MISTSELLQHSSLIWLMATGLLLGGLHALEPGHAKTMIASFVIATRGTLPQAALLGVSAAASHSALIWVLALAGLYFGDRFIGDDAEPWLQLVSGSIIVLIGAGMLWRQFHIRGIGHAGRESGPHGGRIVDTGHGLVEITIFERQVAPHFRLFLYDAQMHGRDTSQSAEISVLTTRRDGSCQSFDFEATGDYLSSTSDIPEPHEFELLLSIAHGDHTHEFSVSFSEDHDHSETPQDEHTIAHARQIQSQVAGRAVSAREVILFGLGSGLMPCPAALTMLLVCLRLKKLVLGVSLVAAFSAGLAVTLVGLGMIAAIGAAQAAKRLSWLGGGMAVLPYLSSAVVMGLGIFMGVSGYTHLT